MTEEEIIDALYEHIEFATNNGRIRPTITILGASILEKRIQSASKTITS